MLTRQDIDEILHQLINQTQCKHRREFPTILFEIGNKNSNVDEKNDCVVSLLHRVNVSPCGEGKTKYPGRSRIKNINLHCTMWNTMTYPLLVLKKKIVRSISCQLQFKFQLLVLENYIQKLF